MAGIIFLLWVVWHVRNNLTFNDIQASKFSTLAIIVSTIRETDKISQMFMSNSQTGVFSIHLRLLGLKLTLMARLGVLPGIARSVEIFHNCRSFAKATYIIPQETTPLLRMNFVLSVRIDVSIRPVRKRIIIRRTEKKIAHTDL